MWEVSGWCPFEDAPPTSDDEYFETLTAAVFGCRFSPEIVRVRWPATRSAFAGFSLTTVAFWPDDDVDRLLRSPGIIRSRKKIVATLRNARALLARARRYGSVRAYFETFRPDVGALVQELDGWAHYVGAPSLRFFVRCAGIVSAWAAVASSRHQRPVDTSRGTWSGAPQRCARSSHLAANTKSLSVSPLTL
jgi:hypothetical protein